MRDGTEYEPNLIIVAAPAATAEKLREILEAAGYPIRTVCTTGEQALSQAQFHAPLLLVTTYRLSDMSGTQLIERMGEIGSAILIAPQDSTSETQLPDYVVTMQNPLSKDAFLQAVSVLLRMSEQMLRLRREVSRLEQTLAERKLIDRAKGRLMDLRQMSEAQAHHCMQKMSMDTGKRLVEIAREILNEKVAV